MAPVRARKGHPLPFCTGFVGTGHKAVVRCVNSTCHALPYHAALGTKVRVQLLNT